MQIFQAKKCDEGIKDNGQKIIWNPGWKPCKTELYTYECRHGEKTGDEKYRTNAERCLNYILGQNATGFCYVTGFGTHPTCHPHHRLSYSHPKGTIPGFLAGGPNPAKQDAATDGVKYPENVPADESYLDYQPSYASNEVTINWNVTLFALSAALDALPQ